jgi:predicted metal-dependent peptidase
MDTLDRIRKAHIALMNHRKEFCRFGGILSCGEVKVTDEVATAATNGWDVMYNPDFVAKHAKTDPELRFLIMHEAMHKAYQHLHVWRQLHDENHRLANIAADHFVNLTLVDADDGEGFIKMLDVGIEPDAQYRGWSVKQIFTHLKDNPPEGDDEGEGEGEGGDGMDSHDWDDAKTGDPSEAQERANEIERALRQGDSLQRKLSKDGQGGSSKLLGDLLEAKVDWRQVLREFVTLTCSGRDEHTWRRPNKRFLAHGLLMPSMYSTTMNELVVGIDTSGSVFCGDEINVFVAELGRIITDVMPSKVHVVYWDTAVVGHQVFEDGQFALQKLKVTGGGGTNGAALFDYIREKQLCPEAIINFTDGYVGDWGTSDIPTMWAVTSNLRSPWGTTIQVEV